MAAESNVENKPTQEIIESTLLDLGLNRYEARVYLSLVSEGVTTAKTVSGITGIPYGKVYEVIDSLARKGFVQVLPTKPAKYRAISPQESVDKIKRSTQEKLQRIESTLLQHLEPVFNKNKKLMDSQNNFWILNGRSTINQKMQELVENAQKNVCIMTTAAGLERLKVMMPHFKSAKSRGIKFSVLAPVGAKLSNEMQHLNGFTCRHIDKAHTTLMIADDRTALIVEPIPDDTSLHYGRDMGVWVLNKAFAKCLEQLFNMSMPKAD